MDQILVLSIESEYLVFIYMVERSSRISRKSANGHCNRAACYTYILEEDGDIKFQFFTCFTKYEADPTSYTSFSSRCRMSGCLGPGSNKRGDFEVFIEIDGAHIFSVMKGPL